LEHQDLNLGDTLLAEEKVVDLLAEEVLAVVAEVHQFCLNCVVRMVQVEELELEVDPVDLEL
jgi:hypothetical protein